MKNRVINVVATRAMKVGSTEHGKAPAANTIGASRRKNYVFKFPLQAAKALHRSGTIAPAFIDDARALRSLGVRCLPYFGADASLADADDAEEAKADEEPSDSEESESVSLGDFVAECLDSGLKADLVAALEAVGLDPDDYATNGERESALVKWQENQ